MNERDDFQAAVLVILAQAQGHPLPTGHVVRRIVERHMASIQPYTDALERVDALLDDTRPVRWEQSGIWGRAVSDVDLLLALRPDGKRWQPIPRHNHDAIGTYGGCPACGTDFGQQAAGEQP